MWGCHVISPSTITVSRRPQHSQHFDIHSNLDARPTKTVCTAAVDKPDVNELQINFNAKTSYRMASFLVVLLVFHNGILLDEHQLQHVTANGSYIQLPICRGKDAYNDRLTAFDSWWLTFLAIPLCLIMIICNAAVNWSWKQGGGIAKFKVNVTGGHVHVLCGDNSKMDVADKRDQLVSTIPYRVYCQLAILLPRDIINVAGRLFNLTLEEAISLRDNTTYGRSSVDAVFQLMKERDVNLGQFVQVLNEMQRFDVLSVLTEAGYPDNLELHCNVTGAAKNREDGKAF
ncbi:hypothetical protein ACROYT_G018350 [Oculina patagonica]